MSAGVILRRLCAGVAAWAVALPLIAVVLVAGPATAQAGCDANRDGTSAGVTETVFTAGNDAGAARLATDIGLTLPAPRPAHHWRVTVCVEVVDDANPATVDRFVVQVGAPVQELRPEASLWEQGSRDKAIRDLTPLMYRPGARTSPPVNGVQVIGIEMWLAVDPAAWVPLTTNATVGQVSVTATAVPTKMVWEFTDGVTRVCDGPGVQYSPGTPGPAPCGRHFEHTTDVQPVTASVRIEYTINWTSTLLSSGTLTQRGEPNRYELMVGEVQTYLSDGTRRAPGPVDALALPKSSQPVNDSNCDWWTPWDCSPADIADAVSDLATDVLWASLPQPVRDALEQVWSFIKGCARFVGDTLGSIQEVFSQFGQVMVDPQAFVRDKLQVAQAMYDGIHADSAGFAKEFFGGMVDAELFKADKAQWAGKIGCELAVGILTGGATASGRFANLLGDVNKFADRVRDWIRRGDKDGDGDVDVCTASFPSGTEVLLADGSRRRIEAIRAGDTVLAFDARNRAWAGRPVLRQWSYLDTDEMATLRLTDGSTLSATDHHRFWSASRGAFEELEALTPGEQLQTPHGPVFVDDVSLWPSAPTLVWELFVAVDHTFAVFAGDSAVAVHNRCDVDPPDADVITRRLAEEGLEGTAEDVQGAWSRYTGDLPPDKWLDKYIALRHSVGNGSEFETNVLKDANVKKNYTAYPLDDLKFIPDGVRSTDPPQFIEAKAYSTTKLGPTSNAGSQLKYLIEWCGRYPDRCREDLDPTTRPSFDLHISNEEMMNAGFRRLLTEADASGVIVSVNRKSWP